MPGLSWKTDRDKPSAEKTQMKQSQSKTALMLFILLTIVVLFFVSQWLGFGNSFFVRWKTFYEGTFNGMPYVLQSREIKGFSTNRIEDRFRLGNLPTVEITAQTTDWGVPYSDDIFSMAPYCYTSQNIPAYQNEEEDPADYQPFKSGYTMQYLSPKTFSKADYEQYCAFMKTEWPKIDREYAGKEYSRFPHIIGLVYARQDDITKIYKGTYNPYPGLKPVQVKKAFIRIQNDGRVQLVDDDQWANINYSGLSARVQMPGKRLFLDTDPKNGGIGSIAVLRTFKDAQGRSPDMDFQIAEKQP